jgi:NADPH2:quinone reductase
MRAVAAAAAGGPEVLQVRECPVPQPGPREVLVRVVAAGVNRPDVQQRLGVYPPPPGVTDILGLEVAGEVAAVAAGVSRWRPGDAVAALVPGGGYGEYVAVHEDNALPVPSGLSMVEAAAVPETFFTVWTNVFEAGGLKPGDALLVHGGSSGIGTTAIQLAKALGSFVIATAGSAEKCDACRRIGADLAVNHREADFVIETKRATQGRGADVILDMVGGDYVARNYQAAAVRGRIVQIAFLKGSQVALDLRPLMTKRLIHTGSTLRGRPVEEKARLARALEQHVWPLLAAGRCRPVIDSTFPLARAADAHRRLEEGTHVGKVVLTLA